MSLSVSRVADVYGAGCFLVRLATISKQPLGHSEIAHNVQTGWLQWRSVQGLGKKNGLFQDIFRAVKILLNFGCFRIKSFDELCVRS